MFLIEKAVKYLAAFLFYKKLRMYNLYKLLYIKKASLKYPLL